MKKIKALALASVIGLSSLFGAVASAPTADASECLWSTGYGSMCFQQDSSGSWTFYLTPPRYLNGHPT